jgi:L-amino acid N-acyltransferase YncA
MISLRLAKMEDADDLLAWRNDPITRMNSRSTAEVSREDHQDWMERMIARPSDDCIVLVAEGVGVVRFDQSEECYEVSITIAPSERGKGLGKDILDYACVLMDNRTLIAEIRAGNLASRRIFEQTGFKLVRDDGEFVQYKRDKAVG